MNNLRWHAAVREWRANRRLRLGVLVALWAALVQLVLVLSDYNAGRSSQYHRDRALLERMQAAGEQKQWPARAAEVEAGLLQLRADLPRAASAGLAQAELQAGLGEMAASAGLAAVTARTEPTVEVAGHPELWQVLGRMEGQATSAQLAAFLQALAARRPWLQVDRLELRGDDLIEITLIARGYYARGDSKETGDAP